MTPCCLQHALNGIIFSELNISLSNPIRERTARRWMIKLGWHRTLVQKGVYMDGYEQEDIMKYQNEVFLLAIAQFETQMAKLKGLELKEIMPELEEGT